MCGQRDLKKVDNRRNPYQISSCSGLTRAHEGIGRNCVDRKTKKKAKQKEKKKLPTWNVSSRVDIVSAANVDDDDSSENEKGNFNARDGWRDIGSSVLPPQKSVSWNFKLTRKWATEKSIEISPKNCCLFVLWLVCHPRRNHIENLYKLSQPLFK